MGILERPSWGWAEAVADEEEKGKERPGAGERVVMLLWMS